MPIATWHYDLSHQLLLDAGAFLSGVPPPARAAARRKQLYVDFFASCSSSERRALAPFPELLDGQRGFANFVPHQCLRQLALIELVDMSYTGLPLDHASLLAEVRRVRGGEVSTCQVLSEVHEAAVQRLLQYSGERDRVYANARFLDLKEAPAQPGDGRAKRVESEVAAQSAARGLVEGLAAALENEGIDMLCFQPNHFATLSVYFEKFLQTDNSPRLRRSRRLPHGPPLAFWVFLAHWLKAADEGVKGSKPTRATTNHETSHERPDNQQREEFAHMERGRQIT